MLRVVLSLAVACFACACRPGHQPSDAEPLQFWHTFNVSESRALDQWLSQNGNRTVTTTVMPFARAVGRFTGALESGQCPDLVRVDSTRIVQLAEKGLIDVVPESEWRERSWLPEARALVEHDGASYGIPQSLDGLALIRLRGFGPPGFPPRTLEELETWVTKSPGKKLGLLIDGYWFVAFLRAAGSDMPELDERLRIDEPESLRALEHFAALFDDGTAVNLLDRGDDSRTQARMFREGSLAVAVNGPWSLVAPAGADLAMLEVAAFPGGFAPRGGQVLVVPRCSQQKARAWKLAIALTDPALQASWANTLGLIPTTSEALEGAGRIPREFYDALKAARPLPRHAALPELFDDLTPAVRAVVDRDATADEALAGVFRSWSRLYERRGVQVRAQVAPVAPENDAQ